MKYKVVLKIFSHVRLPDPPDMFENIDFSSEGQNFVDKVMVAGVKHED